MRAVTIFYWRGKGTAPLIKKSRQENKIKTFLRDFCVSEWPGAVFLSKAKSLNSCDVFFAKLLRSLVSSLSLSLSRLSSRLSLVSFSLVSISRLVSSLSISLPISISLYHILVSLNLSLAALLLKKTSLVEKKKIYEKSLRFTILSSKTTSKIRNYFQ